MADFILQPPIVVTQYSFTTGQFTQLQTITQTLTLTDNQGGDTEFTVGEAISYQFGSFNFSGTFKGTYLHNGQTLPVIQFGTNGVYVVGADTSTALPSWNNSSFGNAPFTVCFCAGTQIATDQGEKAVETLETGDRVVTPSGAYSSVLWVGRQTVHKAFLGPRIQPVRIAAGALGHGLPHSDLMVTGDHGMVFPISGKEFGQGKNEGYVINASALVNGDTIDWVPMSELDASFTIYHVETEAHDVIYANGAASETFIDIPGRRAFDNYQEYLDLYGAERIIPEMQRHRISTQRLLPETIKARLGIVDDVVDVAAIA